MSEIESAFIAAVCAAPDDDLPRLVYADWLEERDEPGDREKAEFIRVQIEISKLTAHSPELSRRESSLFNYGVVKKNGDSPVFVDLSPQRELRAAFPRCAPMIERPMPVGSGLFFVFRRGFVSEVQCTLVEWRGTPQKPGVGPEIVRKHPVQTVTLTDRAPAHLYNRLTRETWCMWLNDGEAVPTLIWEGSPALDPTVRARIPADVWDDSLTGQFATAQEANSALSAVAIKWAKSAPVQPAQICTV